jgi:hypothetical protein
MTRYSTDPPPSASLGLVLVIRGALFMMLILLITFSQLSSGVALAT